MNLQIKPTAFFSALRELARRRLVPTALSTEQLREIDASVRRQALFSARMTQLHALQALQDSLKAMLEARENLAAAKLRMQEQLRALGYDAAAGGFPEDQGAVPPARQGTLRDLASDKRMTLTITTNYRIVSNQVFAARGMEERRLHQWPAWELVRIGRVRTPRGFKRSRGGALEPVPGDDWQARWTAAGGELYDKGTRMIAPKGADVWQKLGDGAGGYKDTLGNPFAPFAFGSKYGVREVARDTCLELGVIEPNEAESAAPRELPPNVVPVVQSKAAAAGLDPALIAAMKRDLARQEDGSVRLKAALDKELAAADKAYRERNAARNRASLCHWLFNSRRSKGLKTPWRRMMTKPHEFHEDQWVRSGGRFAGYVGPKRVDSVKDLLGKLQDDPKADLMAHVMMLDGRVGARLSKAFGRDVRGWELTLHAADYRHAMSTHAAEVKDQWEKIPAIISRAEHIIPSRVKTDSGEKAVEVWRSDGSWLQLVLAEGKDRKIKVKTFKRRQELFNRLFGRGSRITSATPEGGGVLTSKTTQELTGGEGSAALNRAHTSEAFPPPQSQDKSLRARCKALVAAMERRAA